MIKKGIEVEDLSVYKCNNILLSVKFFLTLRSQKVVS